MTRIQRIVVGIWTAAILTLIGRVAFAQVTGDPAEQIEKLRELFGWPGLLAGVGILAITTWRNLAPSVWNSWPRWARFGLGFLGAASPAAVRSLVGGASIVTALVVAIPLGLMAIGLVESAKTVARPKARPGASLAIPIKGPGGTGIGKISYPP